MSFSSQRKASVSIDNEIAARKSVSGSMSTDLEQAMSEPAWTASEEKVATFADPPNPNLVDWDGEDDPKNPINWSKTNRLIHVAIISTITMITSMGASMFAPGVSQVMKDFHETESFIGSLTVTIYVLGFGVGPLIIAPLSELYGRLILYHICNAVYFAFTIGCALSTSMPMFIVFRFIAGCAGAAPLTIGGGTISDVIPQEKRGAAMAMFAIGPLLGPVIGPVAGAFLAAAEGWRWVFWVLAIASGIIAIIALIFMRETYGVVLLSRKAQRLRQESGNTALISKYDNGLSARELFARTIVRPIKMLLLSPIILMISFFVAVIFSYMFLLFTTFPMVFQEQYGFSEGITGLCYLGLGFGLMAALVFFAVMSDKLLKKQANGGEMKPEYRLPVMMYCTPILPIGFLWYGWSAQVQTHWIVPILGTVLIGFGMFCIFMPAQIYLVDAFSQYAASALAANTVLRSIFGAFLPLAGPPLYEALGLGWGNTLLAGLALAFTPVPFLFYRYGERIRQHFKLDL